MKTNELEQDECAHGWQVTMEAAQVEIKRLQAEVERQRGLYTKWCNLLIKTMEEEQGGGKT